MTTNHQSRCIRITQTTINSLRPSKAVQVIRDANVRGFQIRMMPTGKASYWAEARFGGGQGRNMKFKVGDIDIALPEARKRAKDAIDKIKAGIDPLQEKRVQAHEGKTLQQLIDAYLDLRSLKPRTVKHYRYCASWGFKGWLNKRVVDITAHEILDWYRRGKETPDQTNGTFRFLNSLMVFALGLGIIKENPCHMVTRLGIKYESAHRTGHIESKNLGKFFEALIQYPYARQSEFTARDIILLIITTGLRSDEARSLKWENVDLEENGVFTVLDTKNGLDHVVPLTGLTYSLFMQRKVSRKDNDKNSEYVFPARGSGKSPYVTNVQKTLTNICKKAEIPVVSVHDLRRTFATVLNKIGVGFLDLKKLMNHKEKDISAHYAQPDIEALRKWLFQVVQHYDKTFPSMDADSGFTRYNHGALRDAIYHHGELDVRELDPMGAEYQALQIEEEEERPWW